MRIRKLTECAEIIAGDKTRLRELLHPDQDYPFDGRYSLAHAEVVPGAKTLKHKLTTDEVYYILSGKGVMYIENESAEVSAGDAIEIPPGSVQQIENTGDKTLAFLCIVDPAWRAADEDILE